MLGQVIPDSQVNVITLVGTSTPIPMGDQCIYFVIVSIRGIALATSVFYQKLVQRIHCEILHGVVGTTMAVVRKCYWSLDLNV